MPDRFPLCLPFILKEEGGNVDDHRDPGGRTSRGITQRVDDAYRYLNNLPKIDVFIIPNSEVADIYRKQYWMPWCPQLPVGVDLMFFNLAVTSGQYRAILTLQAALGVTTDGHIGAITEASLKSADPVRLINNFDIQQEGFYRRLTTFQYFGRGWTARTERCRAAALQMAETPSA